MKKKAGEKRIVYRIRWDPKSGFWYVECGGETIDKSRLKTAITAIARAAAKALHATGRLAQVVVHGKNGRIQNEWTYGADPRRTKG